MSPSWRKHLYIGLAPDRISMILLGRGLRPKVLAKHDEQVKCADAKDWQAAVGNLARLLVKPEWHGADVSVILSNRFCRFAVLPASSHAMSEKAGEALARHMMKQIYGEAAGQWVLSAEHGKKGRPGLIATLERNLLEKLQQAAAQYQLNLRLVAPYLRPVANRYDARLKEGDAWLVIHEPGYSLIALARDGNIQSINGIAHSGLEELPVLLERESLLNDLSGPCDRVLLHAPTCKDISSISKSAYRFDRLDMAMPAGFPSPFEGGYALPMCEFI